MNGGGNGASAGAATTAALLVLLMLVAAALHADATAARRLGAGDGSKQASRALSGPHPNPCTSDPNNPGHRCPGPGPSPGHQEAEVLSPPLVSVSKASSGPNNCTYNPTGPGKKCISPPTAP